MGPSLGSSASPASPGLWELGRAGGGTLGPYRRPEGDPGGRGGGRPETG